MADSTKHITIDTFKDKHGTSLNRIPIDLVQPPNHESITTWRQSTSELLINLKKVYNHHKRKESNEHKLQTRRHLDNWFMRDLDRYLDEIIRPPVPQGVGAEWPTDAYGQIPTRPSDRLHVNKQIYQNKTESRIKTCPDIETIPWLKELMGTGSKFSAEAITNIERPLTMEDLKRTFTQLKMHAAPGPSGVRNPQWKNAPEQLHNILLDLLNKIYTSGDIPESMKYGTIFPIPKQPDKPCTSENSRPLTMLESGLKILTHCISNRIYDELRKQPIFAPMQYAFLPNKNITDPIKMVEFNQNHARKNGRELHHVVMDQIQAFDRLELWAGDLAMKRLNSPDQLQNLVNNLNQNS